MLYLSMVSKYIDTFCIFMLCYYRLEAINSYKYLTSCLLLLNPAFPAFHTHHTPTNSPPFPGLVQWTVTWSHLSVLMSRIGWIFARNKEKNMFGLHDSLQMLLLLLLLEGILITAPGPALALI